MSPLHDDETSFCEFGERTPLPSTALSDYIVLDLTRVRSGPTCVRQLADWGADVIKIEAPRDKSEMGGPRIGPDFQNLHRNKRSMTMIDPPPDTYDPTTTIKSKVFQLLLK